MTRTLFFWWTKTKRCWSSCPFPYKGSRTSAGYYHFKELCDGEINFCYLSLIRYISIFTCSIIAFRATDYHPSPPPPTAPRVPNATFIYCAKYVNTYTGKSFCGHTEWGKRYAIKLFLISIYFLVKKKKKKKYSFCPKLSPCNSPNGKLIQLS